MKNLMMTMLVLLFGMSNVAIAQVMPEADTTVISISTIEANLMNLFETKSFVINPCVEFDPGKAGLDNQDRECIRSAADEYHKIANKNNIVSVRVISSYDSMAWKKHQVAYNLGKISRVVFDSLNMGDNMLIAIERAKQGANQMALEGVDVETDIYFTERAIRGLTIEIVTLVPNEDAVSYLAGVIYNASQHDQTTKDEPAPLANTPSEHPKPASPSYAETFRENFAITAETDYQGLERDFRFGLTVPLSRNLFLYGGMLYRTNTVVGYPGSSGITIVEDPQNPGRFLYEGNYEPVRLINDFRIGAYGGLRYRPFSK